MLEYVYHVQERLRTLRASLGSSKASQAAEFHATPGRGKPHLRRPVDTTTKKVTQLPGIGHGSHGSAAPDPTALALQPSLQSPGAATSALGPSGSGADSKVEGRLLECEAVQGLCQLLEHHVTVLEQSQEPLNSLLQPAADAGRHLHCFVMLHVNKQQSCWHNTKSFLCNLLTNCAPATTHTCIGQLLVLPMLHHCEVIAASRLTPAGLFIAETDASQQELLASPEALLSQGARQALAAATVMTSAEISAMRSTLQVLASHLTALQVAAKLPSKQGEVVFQLQHAVSCSY